MPRHKELLFPYKMDIYYDDDENFIEKPEELKTKAFTISTAH